MANQREYRRRRYFDQLFADNPQWASEPEWGDIEAEASEPDDQILYRRNVIVARTDGNDSINDALVERGFTLADEPAQFDGVQKYSGDDVIGTVRELAAEFPGRVAPEYVFVTAQRVHPGDDPEPTDPIPGGTEWAERGAGVKIAVIDTGGRPPGGTRPMPGPEDDTLWGNPQPYAPRGPGSAYYLGTAAGHGTFITDLINQVAPAADVFNIKVANPMGACEERAIADGIARALAHDPRPHIVNLSLGMYGLRIGDKRSRQWAGPILFQEAVARLIAEGIVVVASAGNDDCVDEMYPAAWPDVVAVAAVDCEGRRCGFSNFGPWVDASARGLRLRAAYVSGEEDPAFEIDLHPDTFTDWAEWSGTSFAAPLVAAQIAVVMSDTGADGVTAKNQVLGNAVPVVDWGCGVWVRPQLGSVDT